MILGKSKSVNGVNIRLTSERWLHVTNSHKEIGPGEYLDALEIIEKPDFVLKGYKNELLAVKKLRANTSL